MDLPPFMFAMYTGLVYIFGYFLGKVVGRQDAQAEDEEEDY